MIFKKILEQNHKCNLQASFIQKVKTACLLYIALTHPDAVYFANGTFSISDVVQMSSYCVFVLASGNILHDH